MDSEKKHTQEKRLPDSANVPADISTDDFASIGERGDMGVLYFKLSDNVSGVGSDETKSDEENYTTISSMSVKCFNKGGDTTE